MELHRHRSTIDAPDGADIAVTVRGGERGFSWSVANRGRTAVPVRSVGVVHTIRGLVGRLRLYRHGYQSWSQSGLAVAGVDTDPSLTEGTLDAIVMTHHADGRRPTPGHLRSELVTVVADDHDAVLVGFLGGDRHDGTMRVGSGRSGNELIVEAFLGDAVIGPGQELTLHDVVVVPTDDPPGALDEWAAETGRRCGARVGAPYQVGWCSWYHYFEHIDQRSFAANLDRSADWPFAVFQLDDGYQSEVGDWTLTDDSFPSGLAAVADSVRAKGLTAGLWLAPFLVSQRSRLARRHPDWVARDDRGDALVGSYNGHWGGFVDVLDTSHPAVLEHLEALAAGLVEMGFDYLKLDFTYAPAFDGRYHDPTLTPAQRVRAGYDAIRRGAGEDTFLLGCGAPLGACIGVVDGMRIGPDVAPWWEPRPDLWPFPGYDATLPSTLNAWRNTLGRSYQHRRLWLNDPDCLMLRTEDTDLSSEQVGAWAQCVAASGGMALVSDDLALLDASARTLLDEVIDTGRRVDSAAMTGAAPRCEDLMSAATPSVLSVDGVRFEGTPHPGSARTVLD